MIYCNPDYYGCMGYAIDLYDSNYENDLNAAIINTGIERDNINNGCIYSNIDNIRQNPNF